MERNYGSVNRNCNGATGAAAGVRALRGYHAQLASYPEVSPSWEEMGTGLLTGLYNEPGYCDRYPIETKGH